MHRGTVDGAYADFPFVPSAFHAESVAARVSANAESGPDQIAVNDSTTQLTFGELDRRANQLAFHLRHAGAKPEDCVGLLFDRSVDFVVAALAVLKSGAAFLALDSNTPADRAVLILNDADAKVVLTHRQKTRDWSSGDWSTIDVNNVFAANYGEDFTTPRSSFEPALDSLAYVVYTSGSTGRPKGVEITHGNLLNLIDWHQAAFDITATDRASQVAGLGFDASTWEIWPHLCAGATVCIAGEDTRRSPQALRNWLVENKITISFVPTVLAEQLMHSDWPANTALRTLLTGADVLHRRPVNGLPFVVVNNYGPSECTVVATSGVVTADAELDGRPSIGRPIRNTQVLILDAELKSVADGEVGELCIAGDLVGRGYRNLPELTASRFVTIETSSGEDLRIYRTGDRARWLPNGELAFLGRLDEQIKIRGYRIEPGEIVAWLDRFPGIEASAVVVRAGDVGPILVAYVVVAASVELIAADLREFLAGRLPDYMVPTQFVRIAELPSTPNGKLDRSTLPAPTIENMLATSTDINLGPTTTDGVSADDLPAKIGALVADLLNRAEVPVDANFFLLGGHSMLAAQLVARIRDLFNVDLSLRQLFTSPTVAALSAEIVRIQGMSDANHA